MGSRPKERDRPILPTLESPLFTHQGCQIHIKRAKSLRFLGVTFHFIKHLLEELSIPKGDCIVRRYKK